MKKIVTFLLAAILALGCTACGSSGSAKSDRLSQIKEKGCIELCTEPYFAPFEYVDPNQSGDAQYQGVDIEIAKYIADKLGVELKITALDYTAVLSGVADGKYDFAISAIAYAPSRAEAMRLSNVYYTSNNGYGLLVRAEDAGKYNSIESLQDAVVITQSGSVQESLYNQYVGGACKEFKLVANMTDGYLAVAQGKADVCICETSSAGLYAEANGGLATTDFRFEVDPNMNGTCVAMPTDGTESLCDVVNECIQELNASGQIEAWYAQYEAAAKALGVEVGDRMATTDIRKAVLAVRAAKGMLEDPTRYALPDMATAKREANILADLDRLAALNNQAGIPAGGDGLPAPDYNRHSCGSFFMNPILSAQQAATLPEDAPRFDATRPDGTPGVKTSAAWLIDHAGCHKGYKVSPDASAGLSTQHALALTNRGGASAADVEVLAKAVQQAVREAFGVTLVPEPVCIGVL